ncbi:MAG: quinol dehydrogenase ferredoxin subunit NapH [Gammaproteobacteria bacterium]|nr:quinol dehydrogenase ferredoxin subunit NapH [Gammaproteobacteria bacterium]MCP5136627.1 quinol dehydrogenase ferredoxin subunit NapH [Gammaproteobacteria bacterium]
MPATLSGRLRVWRHILARRTTQVGMLLLFYGTFHWDWALFGLPVLSGNPSASRLLDTVPLADPFATLQILLSGQSLESTVLIGAGIILLFYGLLGGRVWCAWFCPINPITDAAGWLRARLGIRDSFHISRQLRYYVLALALILSAVSGVAAFEWVSPISMAHRGVIYGLGLGWMALFGIFLFDLVVLRHGWCGHLCPLGAFYGLLGKLGQLRVAFDKPTCTHCGECARVCPEPQVLNFKKAGEVGLIAPGECSNCGRCIPVCPEDSLSFQLRPMIPNPEEKGL